MTMPYPKSPFLAPRRSNSRVNLAAAATEKADPNINANVDPEHKSGLVGCTANMITAIIGAGIIGIPYAMRETGLCAGYILIVVSALLAGKSLRLLIATAKHVDAPSYETLAEAAFGRAGWVICNICMFAMAWGPMLSYLMIVRDNLGRLLGFAAQDIFAQRMAMVISSMMVILPLSLQRDIADLAKTSRISVLLDVAMVVIVVYFSPTAQSISNAGGVLPILASSTIRPKSIFIGLGVLSFAFSCQHSALIIAGSLERPTRERWGTVTWITVSVCGGLATIIGTFGYIGFLDETEGNVLNNFGMRYDAISDSEIATARMADVARGCFCLTMFFVYPMESFVARHVVMTNLFRGREAHDGDDHIVLDRLDRRVATTIALYLSVIIPALVCTDVGVVLAWTGTVAATTLSYIGPGTLYLGIHGKEYLEMVDRKWMCGSMNMPGQIDSAKFGIAKGALWYILLMPCWCGIASFGKEKLSDHEEERALMTPAPEYRLGKIIHLRNHTHDTIEGGDRKICKYHGGNKDVENDIFHLPVNDQKYGATNDNELEETTTTSLESGEEDPQDETPSDADFVVAIGFVLFGLLACSAGVISILKS